MSEEDRKMEREQLAAEIQRLNAQLELKKKTITQLEKDKEWLIGDFAKSLQFHHPDTTEKFQEFQIRRALSIAMEG